MLVSRTARLVVSYYASFVVVNLVPTDCEFIVEDWFSQKSSTLSSAWRNAKASMTSQFCLTKSMIACMLAAPSPAFGTRGFQH